MGVEVRFSERGQLSIREVSQKNVVKLRRALGPVGELLALQGLLAGVVEVEGYAVSFTFDPDRTTLTVRTVREAGYFDEE